MQKRQEEVTETLFMLCGHLHINAVTVFALAMLRQYDEAAIQARSQMIKTLPVKLPSFRAHLGYMYSIQFVNALCLLLFFRYNFASLHSWVSVIYTCNICE